MFGLRPPFIRRHSDGLTSLVLESVSCADTFGQLFMVHELTPVISCNRMDKIFIRQQQASCGQSHHVGLFRGDFGLKEHICLALHHCQDSAFLTFSDNKIHLSVSEASASASGGTSVNRHQVRNERTSRRLAFKLRY